MKEFLYVGYYVDKDGQYILKVGTTNNLERRRKEHNRSYLNAAHCRMPIGNEFQYLWTRPLSKYNTLRYEDKTRAAWQESGIGVFVNNDRFILCEKPNFVEVKIRKIYQIALPRAIFFVQNYLLTNPNKCGIIICPPRGGRLRRNFLLYHLAAFLSRLFAKIIIFLFFPKCLTSALGYAIISMSRGEGKHSPNG